MVFWHFSHRSRCAKSHSLINITLDIGAADLVGIMCILSGALEATEWAQSCLVSHIFEGKIKGLGKLLTCFGRVAKCICGLAKEEFSTSIHGKVKEKFLQIESSVDGYL